MSIQAKVSPLAQSVTSAAPIAIPDNGILALTQSSNIVLDIAPESVTGYEKSGADLIVQLKSGESLRIANFYAEGQPASQLYLVDRDKLLAVDLPPVAADGPLMAGYVPQETPAGFESLTGADGTIAGLSPGGALLAGAAIIGGGVAIANSNGGGGGGGGGDSSVQPDTTAPAPASGLQIAPDGSSISGTAEPGATVGIDSNGDGETDVSVVVGPDGKFQIPLNPPLTNGETVSVVVTDPAGNSSPPATVQAPDFPDAPQINPSNGSSLSGTAQPGSTVVLTDGNGNPIGQTTVDSNGNWSYTPENPLPDGTVINAVVVDAAGNSGPPASTIIDGVAPAAPVINPSNGTELSGTAEPNSTVTLTDGNGNPIGQVTADGNGNWTYTPTTPIADGTVINVVAQDAAGNTSAPTSTTVDAQAPAAPVVNPSNGTTISGTAEPGSTVTLTDGSGNPIGQVTADGSGNWSFTPGSPLPNGTVVNATATDPTGNTSAPSSITVDAVAPTAPVVLPSNGSEISGTAEPGSTITLTDGSGNPIGQTTADGSGNWSFTPGTPLPDGTVVNATATDPAGNTSGQGSTTVDTVAPVAPVVEPSNGSEISGTAEPGSTITLTDGSGNPIGQTTADGSGNWSFTPGTPLPDGTVVNATATDPAGNTSGQGSTTVDGVAPGVPTIDLSNGTSLSGTAEPNSTVTLTDGSGNPIGEATADGSGNWTFTPATPLPSGTVVNATASDAAGNTGPAATVTVDSSAPAAPVINPSNGATISGTAEAGATVTLTDGSGNPIGQVTADGSGNWSFTPGSPLANGTAIIATATDPTGNTSAPSSITVDTVAPAAPVVEPSNGSEISGTAEPGSTITLTDGSGNPIGQTTADGSGNWSFTPGTPLPDGTVVNATATDPAGNTSGQGSTTVDGVAPGVPTIDLSNGTSLSGTAEPNSTVTLTDGSGNPIGEATADGSGNWTFTPATPLPDGTVVNATASDAAGNTGPAATVTVDSSAPAAPVINPSNGATISGTAEAGATVTLTDGSGNPIGQVTADGSGNWSFTPGSPLANGTAIIATATDPTGNTSAPSSITVDTVAPAAPVVEPSNGSEISGTAEPGSTITLTDGSGNPIGQTTADGSGNWSFTPGTPLPDGTVVNATATDPAGNTSGQGSTTVDGVAPGVPTIDLSNGTSLSGTAEPNSTVTLTDGSGNPIGQTTADGSGNWSFTPGTPLPDGTVVNATATDPAGNTSGQGSTTVDGVAPGVPTIDLSNGTSLSGTAEPNSTVTLTDGSGNPIGEATADGSGNWTFTPATPLPNGTVVNATASDAAGNTGPAATVTVDSSAPAAPVINPSNGATISGTAEAGATVTLTDGSGNPIGQVTADGSGNWSFTPGSPLANGTAIIATATDPTGNTSAPSSITVDTVAPAAPVVEPSNGSEISGTAEPGSTITLTDGSGNPIGQTTADGSGNWSFTPGTPLPDGTVVNATATDPAGNTSGQGSTTVDGVAPGVPTIDLSNGSSFSGTAEPNSTVTLTDGSGNPIGETTADGSGNWTFTPATPLPNGTVVNATASDAAGNTGPAATVTVDSSAPAAPVINPSNGVTISGTAEAGATVTLTDFGGNPIGRITADGSGNWSFTPGSPLANGTVIIATATDPTGNTGPQAATTVDSVAPVAPVVEPSNGSEISGTAEPGSRVILTDGSGNPIGQTTVDGNGNWSFTPSTPLANGTVVNAVAQDPAGNTGPQGSTTVDSIAPAAPVVNPSNGAVLNGTAEPNSTVTLTDGSGNPIGEATTDGSGNWTFTPGTQLPDGTVVNATATDAAGNTGAPGSTTVDSSLPSIPQVDPSNGSVISGTADANNTIIITDGSGNPIGQVSADGSGNWSFTPGVPLPDGTVVNVVARNASNIDSAPAIITVDGVAPAAPVVEPSNGTEISGTAEAGATVILTDGGGNPIGQTTADGSGNWSFSPGTPLANGTVINAVAQDPAGNTSGPASVTVDAIAPAAPIINPSNGVVISGTAEAGAKVILTNGSGNPIGETTADGSGNWAFTPAPALANGTVINAVAQDPSGNTSGPTSTTVDTIAPAAPVINPSNGVVISGTAEIGAKVILTDGSGNPIGQATADGSGNWSFTPGTPLANGTVINAVAQDPAGNTSTPQVSTTVDAVAPGQPTIEPSNGTEISGTAEAGAKVILTDGSGNPIGQTTADGSGNWSFTPGTPLANGTVINAVAQDPAGNTSGPASVTVDAIAPTAPIINPSNGVVISGTAEAGAKVILTNSSGNPIGETTADGSGNWAFTPAPALANGTVINAVAQDPSGNTSGPTSTTVDTIAPATPVINPSNGVVISGTAEVGAKVILTDGSGNPIGQATADGSGNWSFTPGTPLANGTVINAVAQDPAGNTSTPQVSTTVDAVAPGQPTIEPSNGTEISGTVEAGAKVILTDGSGNPIGETTADGSGNWSFTPGTPLANGTVINAVAQDPAGNTSAPVVSTTVDAIAPAAPTIEPSNGVVLAGTAEPGATVILTDGGGNPIGETTADGSGDWSFTPTTPLPNGTVVNAVAEDAAGNTSGPASTTVDTVAPSAPLLSISADGALLTGTAEPNSQVRLVIDGDTANPITVNVDGSGNFSLPFAPPLITGELISGVTADAAGNLSGPSTINAPDLAPPSISVPEAADTWINAAEISDGIQVDVTIRPTMQVGQVITVAFAGQNGYETQATHTITAGDILAGSVTVTIPPGGGMGPFPEGASTVTADINGGTASNSVPFTVDTIPPATPVLSLVGSILTISTDPGTDLTVEVDIGGVTATATVTADNSGLASLNLLTDLDIDLTLDQLLNAQVSVTGEDPAGNTSNVATIGVGSSIEQPVTIGNFGVDVSLNPLNPRFGFSGVTEPDSSVVIRVITPALNVELLPITADNSGNFSLNLLSPTVLTQLGLNITDILNLGSQISFNIVATDTNGNDSSAYGITLTPNGLSLNIGQIDVNGTSGDDIMSGASGSSEHINGGDGNDLIFSVGTGDHVVAGNGNDAIQITATNFVSIDGGAGFDTLILADGIDLDYNAVGVGTLSNIERIDLGKGDSGSVLTLTAAEVDAITDANNVLQITGESNDTLNVVGAVNTGTTQQLNGITYDVYNFGSSTLLIEDNTVQVVV